MSSDIIWNRYPPTASIRRSDWYKTLIELIDSLGTHETSGYHQLIIPTTVLAIFETIFMSSSMMGNNVDLSIKNTFILNSKYSWLVFVENDIANDMIYINPNSKFKTQIKVKHYDN